MMRSGKLIAFLAGAVAIVVLVAAGFGAKDRIVEGWHLWKLENGDEEDQIVAAEKLGEVRSARAAAGLVVVFRLKSKKVAAHPLEETFHCRDLRRHVELWSRLRRVLIEVGKPATTDLLREAMDEDDVGVAMCLVRALLEIHGYPTSSGDLWSRSRPVYPGQSVLRKLRDDASSSVDTRQLASEVLKRWFS